MSSLSFIIIGSFWPSLQPKVGQTHFLQPCTHKSRYIFQIWYVGSPLYTARHKIRFFFNLIFGILPIIFARFGFFQFSGLFSTCFQILISKLLHTSSRRHFRSSSGFIAIRTFWPTLQPKVGQIQFWYSWGHLLRCSLQICGSFCFKCIVQHTCWIWKKISKLLFSRIFNAFHQLMNYNRQNQCPYQHYRYPSLVTGAHFAQVDQGDYDFIPCQRSLRET